MEPYFCIISFFREAEHGIGDDPVTAFDKDLLSVYVDLTAAGKFIPGCLNFAYAYLYILFIANNVGGIGELLLQLVQLLRTVAAGPPQFGMLQRIIR